MDEYDTDLAFQRFNDTFKKASESTMSFEEAIKIVTNYCSIFDTIEPSVVYKTEWLQNSKEELIEAFHVYYLHAIQRGMASDKALDATLTFFEQLRKFVDTYEHCIATTMWKLFEQYGQDNVDKLNADFPDLMAVSMAILGKTSLEAAFDMIVDMRAYVKALKQIFPRT